MSNSPTIGDLRVWHIPQIPGKPFHVPVKTVREAVNVMRILADYDLFQFENRIKPDYSNAQGLEIYEPDDGDGKPGWCSWYDEETGHDDPEEYLEEYEFSDEFEQR